ncbi:FANCM protein, partial [Cisticola juncidis]|nr:FANCM protein [Cisticola juncidis]
MRAVYLSSVRSPALGSRYKMVHREFNPAVFSQIPEQDESYAQDSFCVGEEEEEEEEAGSACSEEDEECVSFELLPREGSSSTRPYLTRHRRRMEQARLAGRAPGQSRKKPSRIIVLSDSSEEEMGASRERALAAGQGKGQLPKAPSAQPRSGAGGQHTGGLLGHPTEPPERGTATPPAGPGPRNTDVQSRNTDHLQAAAEVSSSVKTHGSSSGSAPSVAGIPRVPGTHSPSVAGIPRVPGTHSASPCVLAASRELSSGAAVLSCLRAVHGLRVRLCPLGSSDYIVSTRLAVERLLQSELQSPRNRSRLSQRLQRLQGAFQRICVIVETDRVRPGETSRVFQRTQHYDGVLSALIQAGIRILFSSCQEETAALLKELALLEHRKDAAIQVPTEPEGHWRDLLSFYLSIPNLSYGAALNLCHAFGSIAAVANSSVAALAAGARLSRAQAEELHRFLRHDCDPELLPQPLPKGKS